jgi:hypothetical protein
LLKDVGATQRLGIEPELHRRMLCPKCFESSTVADAPDTCDLALTAKSKPCGEPLWIMRRGKCLPRRLSSSQSLIAWLTWFLAVEGVEEALEEYRRHRPDASGEMHGLWDSPAWRQMGDYLNPDDTSLNLVFAFFMDWFNPFTNRQAGKKISLGAPSPPTAPSSFYTARYVVLARHACASA